MLEKGPRKRVLPQVCFPWNNELEISDLIDRRWLKHESFAFSTLHAHLPIPDELTWEPTASQKKDDTWKWPHFQGGILEAPNMLGIDGREAGTVAMRYFLELPIADSLRAEKQTLDGNLAHADDLLHLPTAEAFRAVEHGDGSAIIGKRAPRQDRLQLLQGGPRAWKRVGVREITTQAITDRLSMISEWHNESLAQGWCMTVLDRNDCGTLHNQVFTKLLYPPQKLSYELDPHSIKVQIEALVKVLTTPGAWLDFSLPYWRLRFGQILWELPPGNNEQKGISDPLRSMERKWLLVQLLLSVELVLRLDAVLKHGTSEDSDKTHISSYDIHHFNKLRNKKVDWDTIVARRLLDHFYVPKVSDLPSELTVHSQNVAQHSLLSSFKHKLKLDDNNEKNDDDDTWNCLFLPRRPRLLLDGLLRFARIINWPEFEDFEKLMERKLYPTQSSPAAHIQSLYANPICGKTICGKTGPSRNDRVSGDIMDQHSISLHVSTPDQPGGWLSRSWLTGLVLPGESSSHLLMSTLLENDPKISQKLGSYALLHGGFVLNGKSWWSKSCVVGRVMAPLEGTTECMGWISCPSVLPVDTNGEPHPMGWVDVRTQQIPSLREETRIHDGLKVAEESSPLGIGHGIVLGTEFIMPKDKYLDELPKGELSSVAMILRKTEHDIERTRRPSEESAASASASLQFTLRANDAISPSHIMLSLTYNVYFVSANPCRLPHKHAHLNFTGIDDYHSGDHPEHLPSHPLHKSYNYSLKTVSDLLSNDPPDHIGSKGQVWLIDARGSREKDVFVRAWCSQVGRNALVARVGKTCPSCCIREAKAIEVGIIIRIGGRV